MWVQPGLIILCVYINLTPNVTADKEVVPQVRAIFSEKDLEMLAPQMRSMTLMHILNPPNRHLKQSRNLQHERAALPYKSQEMSPVSDNIAHMMALEDGDQMIHIRQNIYKEISRIQYKINYVLGYRCAVLEDNDACEQWKDNVLADMRTVIIGRSQMHPNPAAAAMALIDNIAQSNVQNAATHPAKQHKHSNYQSGSLLKSVYRSNGVRIINNEIKNAAEKRNQGAGPLSVDMPFHVLAEMMRTQKSSGIGTSDRLKLLG